MTQSSSIESSNIARRWCPELIPSPETSSSRPGSRCTARIVSRSGRSPTSSGHWRRMIGSAHVDAASWNKMARFIKYSSTKTQQLKLSKMKDIYILNILRFGYNKNVRSSSVKHGIIEMKFSKTFLQQHWNFRMQDNEIFENKKKGQ